MHGALCQIAMGGRKHLSFCFFLVSHVIANLHSTAFTVVKQGTSESENKIELVVVEFESLKIYPSCECIYVSF